MQARALVGRTGRAAQVALGLAWLSGCGGPAPVVASAGVGPAASGAPAASAAASAAPPPLRRAGPRVWTQIAPAPAAGEILGRHRSAFFADGQGAWRCAESRCERWSPGGEATGALALACPLSERFAVAPRGTAVAQVCGGQVVVSDTAGGARRAVPAPAPDLHALAVDDRGTVTATAPLGGGRWAIVRLPAAGAARRHEVQPRSTGPVEPGVGALLAWTGDNGPDEAAWFDGEPPIEAGVRGLSLVNGEHLWVSSMSTGYLRQRATASEAVPGSPRGGMPPCGVLMDHGAWGPEGLMFVYEQAVLLVDARLERVAVVPLPTGTLELKNVGKLALPRGVERLLGSPDGGELFAILADGSIRRWEGPFEAAAPGDVCRRDP